MVERNGENNAIWSRVQGKPIEVFNGAVVNIIEKINNHESLMQAVLKNRGFDSLVQMYLEKDSSRTIPTDILREIMLVDCLDADNSTKLKLATYRVWALDGHYTRIKDYLPETSIGLEQIQSFMSVKNKDYFRDKSLEESVNEVMMDEGELGRYYNMIHETSGVIDELLPLTSGFTYIRKYELMARTVLRLLKNQQNLAVTKDFKNKTLEDYKKKMIGLVSRIRSEVAIEKKRQKQKNIKEHNQQEDSLSTQIELLKDRLKPIEIEEEGEMDMLGETEELTDMLTKGKAEIEILEITGISKNKLNIYKSALRVRGRLKVYPSRKQAYEELTIFISAVEDLINRNQGVQLSNREMAEELNSSTNRVQYARQILVVLGKTTRPDLKIANMRRSNTFENLSKIKKTLFKLKQKYPGRTITLEELQRVSGAPVSLDTISEYLKLISNNENIPLRLNSLERAKAILIDEGRSNQGMPLDFRFLEKKYRISREYFTRAYGQIRNSNQDIVSHADYYKSKKEKLMQILNKHLVNFPNASIDLTLVADKLGLHPATVYKWYWDLNKTQQVPKSNSNSSKIPKKDF